MAGRKFHHKVRNLWRWKLFLASRNYFLDPWSENESLWLRLVDPFQFRNILCKKPLFHSRNPKPSIRLEFDFEQTTLTRLDGVKVQKFTLFKLSRTQTYPRLKAFNISIRNFALFSPLFRHFMQMSDCGLIFSEVETRKSMKFSHIKSLNQQANCWNSPSILI